MRKSKSTRPRRRAAALLAALSAAFCLAGGCSAREPYGQIIVNEKQEEQEEGVSLTFFGYKADALNLVAIEDALHGFMEQNPDVTITYEGLKGSAYWNAFDQRASLGFLDDIFTIDHDRVLELGGAGRLADLSGLESVGAYGELARSQFENADGTVYFLPTCLSSYGMYINYDLLEAHGQKIPENLDEFAAVCDYFVSQGVTPIIANNYFSLHSVIAAKGLYPLYQLEDVSGEIEKINSGRVSLAEYLRPGVELAGEMLSRGWLDGAEVLETSQTSGDLALFAQGDRPFMITGGWASPRLMDMEPGFSYGVYPLPLLEDGSVAVLDVNTCVSVNAEGKYVDQALAFVNYLTEKDVLWAYCDSQSSYTPLNDDRVPSDETIAPTAEYLTNGRSVLGSDYRLTAPLGAALRECSDALCRGEDADSAYVILENALAQ